MEAYFNQETLNKVDDLMKIIWNGNRLYDTACNVLKVNFNMYNLEEVLHQNYAHFFPEFSDKLVGFLEGYNTIVNYPATMESPSDLHLMNPIEIIIELREYFLDFRKAVYDLALSLDRAKFTEYDLAKFLEKINLELVDKTHRIIKIENELIGSLRPDSSKREIIDLDNYIKW